MALQSSPPPIPPRVDLGESVGDSDHRNDAALFDNSTNLNGNESSTPPTDSVKLEEQVILPKPLPAITPKPSIAPKSGASLGGNETKLPKKKETKGRPEISIMSARPMDQMSIPPSSDLKSDNGVSTPHEDHYNNSSEKPIVTPRDSVKPTALENKRPPKSAAPSPPKKPTPYVSKMDRKSIKLSDSAAGVKPIPDSGRTTKTKNSKTDSSFSIFYVDSIADSSSKQDDQNQVISGKTGNERLSGEIGGKSVSKENDKLKPDIQVNRKSKNKEERIKKPAETESTVTSKQHETTVLKPKVKPTIITAKKPKKTRTVDNSNEKTGNRASLNGKSLLEDSNSLANSVQPLRELNKPGRPNCPPSTTVEEHQSDTTQPQRPKAPPNTVQEDQKYSGKVKKKNDEQKVSKHQQLTQGKSKAKPPRPPMAKEGAKIKPVRSAPAQPNVERKRLSAKQREQSNLEQKSGTVSLVKSSAKSGPPRAIAKFDYTSGTADDLSFKAGDTIMLISKVDNAWFVGYLENDVMQQGLFPVQFVDIIVNLKEETPSQKVQDLVSSNPHAVALHDFEAQAEGELSFSSGQTIILIERINDDWLKGEINNAVGIFPQNFVRIERDLPKPAVSSQKNKVADGHTKPKDEKRGDEWCRAIHDFQGEHEDDLSFSVGNEIRITERLDNDWLKGVFSGRTGIFPASFVEMINEAAKTSKDFAVVTALHDYPGETPDDLSFTAGDQIKIVKRINSGWLMGEFNGKEGLFPASFVNNVPKSSPEPKSSSKKELEKSKDARFAKAVHDFSGEHPGELHFRVGDVIQVLREIDSNWCEGKINNITGIFPTSFVEMEPLQPKETCLAKALYDFEGEAAEDLSFKAGDVIQLLERVNEEWWTGSLGGKIGHFPTTYVEIV